jgi:hypothetical protein
LRLHENSNGSTVSFKPHTAVRLWYSGCLVERLRAAGSDREWSAIARCSKDSRPVSTGNDRARKRNPADGITVAFPGGGKSSLREKGARMFDPYHTWLGIPQNNRPQTYYDLLGIAANELDRGVIQEAAIRRISQIRIYQAGPYERECVRLLNEIAEAETTLVDPARRKVYDARLVQGAEHRTSKGRAEARRKSAIEIPILEKRLALPATPVGAGHSPFEELFERGPIIIRLEHSGSRCRRQRKNRPPRLDPLAVLYLGFLILAGFLGYWLRR